MFSFLKRIDVENIPILRSIFSGLITTLNYSVLLWFIFLANFHWFSIPLVIISVSCAMAYSWKEDNQTVKKGEYKMEKDLFIYSIFNLIIFWSLIAYLFLNVNLSFFAIQLICLACALAIFKTLSSIFILTGMMNALKRVPDIRKKYENNKIDFSTSMEDLEKENKSMKKQAVFGVLFAFLPAIFGIFFLYWAFYYVIVALNIPLEFKLYIVFVIIFEIVLSNFSRILKKQLINKIIDEIHE